MRRDIDEQIAREAGRRAGVFTRHDVVDAGGDRSLIARRLAAGLWVDHGHRVLALHTHRPDQNQARWVALLAAGPAVGPGGGAHLSHQSAIQLHGVDLIASRTIAVTVPPTIRVAMRGVHYHRLGDVRPHHRATVGGFPSTSPARTVLDLAAVVPPPQLAGVIEDLVVRRLTSIGRIASVLADVRRQGKTGVASLVDVLADLDGEPPPASALEGLLHEAARRAGVDVLAQAPLPSRPRLRGLVDLAVPASMLILEADGRRWHSRRQDMSKDRQRDRESARLGWLTLRFVHSDLTADLAGCINDIRTTHLTRLQSARP